MNFLNLFENCRLCPRECGANRLNEGEAGRSGYCRESHCLRVAYIGPHFGEEPPLTGTRGSGTIFFSGCSLGCVFCQNHQISSGGVGAFTSVNTLLKRAIEMIQVHGVHNINLVTPDHFFPHAFQLVSLLRRQGYGLPIIYNLSGYQSIAMLRVAEPYADIYMPDFKYTDPSLALRLAKCRDYPKKALEAIAEMVRQKGFLDASEEGSGPATKGVLVRHLILPGKIENSLTAMTTLFLEFGAQLPLSIMSQYHPVPGLKDPELNRFLTKEEFHRVYSYAMDLGFERLFVQFPDREDQERAGISSFLPDFSRIDAFDARKPL